MKKMFACKNGTLIKVDDILSIEKSDRFYAKQGECVYASYTNQGVLLYTTKFFPSVKELEDAIHAKIVANLPESDEVTIVDMIFVKLCELICWPFEKIFGMLGKIFRKIFRRSEIDAEIDAEIAKIDAEIKAERSKLSLRERIVRDNKNRNEGQVKIDWESYLEKGYYCPYGNERWCPQEWEVKVRGQRETIHISCEDYERLRAEIANRK